MAHLIDKDALVTEIKRRMDENRGKQTLPQYYGMVEEDLNILSFIDTLEMKENENPVIPKHSYFEHIYHCGSEPRWKIGDILAVYEFYRDYEGEYIYGEITDIKMDEENEDYLYTFKDGDMEYENMLISEETYKKN